MAEDARKLRENLEKTLEIYRKNKTNVPMNELVTKYKTAYEKLLKQVQEEAEALLNHVTTSGFIVKTSDGEPFIEAMKQGYKVNRVGERIGKALFQHYSMEEFDKIAKEQREWNEKLYKIYFDSHVCLYVTPGCWDEESSEAPLIYNDLTEEFYDDKRKVWEKREGIPEYSQLIFVRRERKESAG